LAAAACVGPPENDGLSRWPRGLDYHYPHFSHDNVLPPGGGLAAKSARTRAPKGAYRGSSYDLFMPGPGPESPVDGPDDRCRVVAGQPLRLGHGVTPCGAASRSPSTLVRAVLVLCSVQGFAGHCTRRLRGHRQARVSGRRLSPRRWPGPVSGAWRRSMLARTGQWPQGERHESITSLPGRSIAMCLAVTVRCHSLIGNSSNEKESETGPASELTLRSESAPLKRCLCISF
jgi:hypothetical protein